MKKNEILKLTAMVLVFSILMTVLYIPAIAKMSENNPFAEESATIVGEIESMRSETEKVFKLSDGKFQKAIYTAPVHFKDQNGKWQNINNTLKSKNSEEYITKNAKNDILLSKKYKKGKTVELVSDKYNISWGFVGAKNSAAEIIKTKNKELKTDEKLTTLSDLVSTTIYKNIFENIDAEYILSGGKIKENLILKDKSAQSEYELEYRYKNLNAIQKDNKTIELQNNKEEVIYTITAPVMTDANGASSNELSLKIEKKNQNKLTVKLSADESWLNESEREYPVTVDPSIDLHETYIGVQIDSQGINYTNDSKYKSAVSVTFHHLSNFGTGTYVTNAVFRLFYNNIFEAELPIYYLGDSVGDGYISHKINNTFPDDISYVSSGGYYSEWNITKGVQNSCLFNNDTDMCFAIAGESTDLYNQMGYNEETSSFNIQPALQITYVNRSGINEKYSYHEFDMQKAGIVYIDDLTQNIAIKRTDFSVETSAGTVDMGMLYSLNFNYHIGVADNGYRWKPYYSENVSYYPNNSKYKYVWNTSDGRIVYFCYHLTDENNNTYYYDDGEEGYKLYNITEQDENGKSINYYKIVTSDSKVYEFSFDGKSIGVENEKCLTKIYQQGAEGSALKVNYNSKCNISDIIDSDGNVYNFTYDENNPNNLTSIECESQDKLVEYTYNENNNLSEVTCENNCSNYEYPNNGMALIIPNDYKLSITGANYARTIAEYGYDSDSNTWVIGNKINTECYNFKTSYLSVDLNNKTTYTENYYFDKNGYLESVINNDGYALNQNSDSKGKVIANTDITIPVINMSKNSSFEKGAENWTLNNAAIEENTVAYFGNKILKINNSTTSTSTAKQVISGLAKGTYTFSAFVKTGVDSSVDLSSDKTIYDGISIRAKVGEKFNKSTGVKGKFEDWTRVYVTFDISESNSSAELEFGLYNAKGTVFFDAVQFEKHKRPYDYNAVENADFSDNSSWSLSYGAAYTIESSMKTLDSKVLRLTGYKDQNVIAEQVLNISNTKELSVAAWVKTVGMLPGNDLYGSAYAKISLVGINGNVKTVLGEKTIDSTVDKSDNPSDFKRIMFPVNNTNTAYSSYKLCIEYYNQNGYMYVDGVELMRGVVSSEATETDSPTESEPSIENTEDYQMEDGYTFVKKINSFDEYSGTDGFSYLVNGAVVLTTDENNNQIKDETASTAYLGKSWGITANKDKYEYKKSDGETVTIGGISIPSGSLDKTHSSGLRFWYKSTANCTVTLRASTFGNPNKDYSVTLPAAPKGAWKTISYREVESSGKNLNNFKYLFVKTTIGAVYVDELQTVLADSILYDSKDYNIADKTKEQNHNYPIIDEYIYGEFINKFNGYTGEFSYLVNGTQQAGTAYSGNSWGVTANKDIYTYTDAAGEKHWSYGIHLGYLKSEAYAGIRFWYKSAKPCRVSIRNEHYGDSATDYSVTLSAAPNGDWCTMLFDDMQEAGLTFDRYKYLFVKTMDSPAVYIDELQYVKLDEGYYSVSESYEQSRDGKVMKTVNSSKSITVGDIDCTLSRETNSVGVNTYTTTDEETGNQISATDGNGNTVNYTYDEINNLVNMSQEVDETNIGIEYTYNDRGQIETITNENVTYTYKYTPFGDIQSISVGDTELVRYYYGSNQNRDLSMVYYANGQRINYYYENGMLYYVLGNQNTYYINDELGEMLKTKDFESFTTTLTYLDETQVWDYYETELLYSYSSEEDSFNENVNGTEFKTIYTSEDKTAEENTLTTTETTAFGNTTKTVYSDAFGRTVKEETKNGDTVVFLKTYEYNSNGKYTTDQIKSVTTTVGNTTPETTRYTYDNNGNITGIYSKTGEAEEKTVAVYEYDELGQLVKDELFNYTYDNSGNILSKNNMNYEYDDSNWQDKLTNFNGQDITYDKSGNPITYRGATLTWKNGRELAKYQKGSITVTYDYNADGLRTRKKVDINGTVMVYKYTWLDDKLVHQEWDDKYLHFYYDNDDEIIGFAYKRGSTVDEYSYIKNLQGDIIGIVDKNGKQVAKYGYLANGTANGRTGDLCNINPIRYRGYYYDDEINMYYLQSRYYDQFTSRFINADDTEYIGYTESLLSLNIFAYCENNPVKNVDPNGNTIRIYGKKAVRNKFIKYIKKLTGVGYWKINTFTNGRKESDNDYCTITRKNTQLTIYDVNHMFGLSYNLVSALDKHAAIISIKESKHSPHKDVRKKNHTSPQDKKLVNVGTNSTVYINFNDKSKEYVQKISKKKKSTITKKSPIIISLAHELIHALRNARGDTVISNSAKDLVKNTFKLPSGKNKTEYVLLDEMIVTGIGKYYKEYDYNENRVRKEHKYRQRIAYVAA